MMWSSGLFFFCFFFFKQKTAYEMRISDWSSDVCSSDLSLAGLLWLARSPHALFPLLLAPPAFVAAAGWMFARTLFGGRIPLVGRIAAALDGTPWEAMAKIGRAHV